MASRDHGGSQEPGSPSGAAPRALPGRSAPGPRSPLAPGSVLSVPGQREPGRDGGGGASSEISAGGTRARRAEGERCLGQGGGRAGAPQSPFHAAVARSLFRPPARPWGDPSPELGACRAPAPSPRGRHRHQAPRKLEILPKHKHARAPGPLSHTDSTRGQREGQRRKTTFRLRPEPGRSHGWGGRGLEPTNSVTRMLFKSIKSPKELYCICH